MNFPEFVIRLFLAIIYLVVAVPFFIGIYAVVICSATALAILAIAIGFVGVSAYGLYHIVRSQIKRFVERLAF